MPELLNKKPPNNVIIKNKLKGKNLRFILFYFDMQIMLNTVKNN